MKSYKTNSYCCVWYIKSQHEKKGASKVSCFSYLARKNDYICYFRRTSMSAAQRHAAKQQKPLIGNLNYAFHSLITCNTQRKTQKVIMRKIERAILSINVCQQLWSLWRTMIWPWQTDDSRNAAQILKARQLLVTICTPAFNISVSHSSLSLLPCPHKAYSWFHKTVSKHLVKIYGTVLLKGGDSKIQYKKRHHNTSDIQNEWQREIAADILRVLGTMPSPTISVFCISHCCLHQIDFLYLN